MRAEGCGAQQNVPKMQANMRQADRLYPPLIHPHPVLRHTSHVPPLLSLSPPQLSELAEDRTGENKPPKLIKLPGLQEESFMQKRFT